jgi:heme A synthase
MVLEALIGAGLVLFDLVAFNTSVTRAIVRALHLPNTYLQLGSITHVVDGLREAVDDRLHTHRTRRVLLIAGTTGILMVVMSGAMTALGDTLFPSETILDGVRDEFSPNVHFLIRLRV